MDQELIAHFERLFSSLSQRMEQGFHETGQQIQFFREETADRFTKVDQRFDKVEFEVHKTRILLEDLEDKVQLVAEGVTGVREELEAHKAEVSTRFDRVEKRLLTIEAYAHTSYENLSSRIRKRQSPDPKSPKGL